MLRNALTAALLCSVLSTPAAAALFIDVQRINDTEAILLGSGELGGLGFLQTVDLETLRFVDLLASGSPGQGGTFSGNLMLGPALVDDIQLASDTLLVFETPTVFNIGDPLSGTATVELTGATLMPTGTSGALTIADNDGNNVNVGTYTITQAVIIPLPGTLVALATGLGALTLLRGRRDTCI